MSHIRVKSRGSCGEFIQGFYHEGRECLISCPIDCHTEVVIGPGSGKREGLGSKSLQMVAQLVDRFSIDPKAMDSVDIVLTDPLPIGKGYASSTADMVAVAVAIHAFFDKTVDLQEVAAVCCSIEPTDSTLFDTLTLFDHIGGEVLKQYDWCPEMEIMVLEMEAAIDTLDMRSKGLFHPEACFKSQVPFWLFEQAMDERSPELLGRAMTLSALENQSVMEKPNLEEILEVAGGHGAIGINTAHSGSTVGLFFIKGELPWGELLESLRTSGILDDYPIQRRMNVQPGAATITVVKGNN